MRAVRGRQGLPLAENRFTGARLSRNGCSSAKGESTRTEASAELGGAERDRCPAALPRTNRLWESRKINGTGNQLANG
jgi:hypothetical protein